MRKVWGLCAIALLAACQAAGTADREEEDGQGASESPEAAEAPQESPGGIYEAGLAAAGSGDFAAAMDYWSAAARDGDARAAYNIGQLYRHGDGVAQDDAEAARWFLAAARGGLAQAQEMIGSMYANGTGVEQDTREAVRWTAKAAEQGDGNARAALPRYQTELGWNYMGGRNGVAQDAALSCMWFGFAAESGQGDAAGMAESTCGVLDPAQRSRLASVSAACRGSGFERCG